MPDVEVGEARAGTNGISRRRFIGYLIAAPTLVAAADLRAAPPASAAVTTVQPVDFYDLTDLLTDSANLTAGLITVTINSDGTASFALPRAEVGQGITTAVAMVIADELELPLDKVNITLSDARPELEFNQLTGGSNSMHVLYDQVRVAAAIARGQLAQTAAAQLETPLPKLALTNGVITAPDGTSLSYGSLANAAAASRTQAVLAQLKPASQQTLVGTPQPRIDAMEIVTGRKQFAMDLDVPGALPTMVCRPPTINGTALAVLNQAEVSAMDGVTDVAIIPHTEFVPGGVAVRATTFGECIDAVRALQVQWAPGAASSKSDADVLRDLTGAELPMTPGLGQTLDQRFTFYFRPGDPLETNCAIADVQPASAEIWSAMKSPIYFQETVAQILGLPASSVTAHVTQGGGSFGRHLFADAAFEAAVISKAIGKPVKLMWHRTDNFRQGRVHPMCTSRVRITYLANNVLAFDQRHTSVATDFTHGLGEILSATLGDVPEGDYLGYSQSVFTLTANVPYNFGPVTQLLNEVYHPPGSMFNTSSVRNIYSPEVTVAKELMVDRVANAMGQDPYQFRRSFVRDSRMLAVLDAVAKAADWGKRMAPLTAQGIGIHHEYKGYAACVVEIDCTPKTVNRTVENGYTGPRVTRVTYAVDVGLPINPLGLEAQMIGGIMDGIAQALTYSLHLQDGYFLEGSWDNAYYTREWNCPPNDPPSDGIRVIIMPANQSEPGGAGEFGVAASMAAVANAYARATGTMPTSFPINHNQPLGFTPLPTVPPIPQSPTDGLQEAF
ncbi:MAG TPA: molybdopterin cofactor-binding domain-containing protein [Solirubrobacteraceae bacterium]|nr:molybdopterin cofactor-binding domain-containing protein [Solirubrobacteraceae bacterium]